MKKRIVFFLFVLLWNNLSYGQSDTLNQLDSKGKKTGWWLVLLDGNLKIIDDSSKASHCLYNYYVNGIHTYRYGESYGTKKCSILFPEKDTLILNNKILLHGIYTSRYKNGNLRSELFALNGVLTNFKMYDKRGDLAFEVIYSTECGAPSQHCIIEYNKDGSVKRESKTRIPG